MKPEEQLKTLAELAHLEEKASIIVAQRLKATAKLDKVSVLLEGIRKEKDVLEAEAVKLKSEHRQTEHAIFDEKAKIKKWESHAQDIRGEREYTALLSEIGSAKRLVGKMEDAQLERMEALEALEKKQKKNNELFAKYEKETQDEQKAVVDELTKVDGELAVLDSSRKTHQSRLPSLVQKRYEMIFEKKQHRAVTTIGQGDKCMLCHRIVPSQLVGQVRRGVVVETCPGCNRFLVHANHLSIVTNSEQV